MKSRISRVRFYWALVISGAVLIAIGSYKYLSNPIFDFSILHTQSNFYKVGYFIGYFAISIAGLISIGIGIKLFATNNRIKV